ncbi:MAG: hypothetical protein PHQ23_03890 [Candidatus Wallbacteria bacterium]|nr:hypothetical protein [Candidatus Wallbacteria bacterium]
MYKAITVLIAFLFPFAMLLGADISATLDSNDGSSSFAVLDSGSTVNAKIDSDGNIQIKGGLRLDAGGLKCTTSEMLIVDGIACIGGTSSLGNLTVDGSAPAIAVKAGAADHVYINFYADSDNPATRSAWFGYGSAGTDIFSLNNLQGDVFRFYDRVGIGNDAPDFQLDVDSGGSTQTLKLESDWGQLRFLPYNNTGNYIESGNADWSLSRDLIIAGPSANPLAKLKLMAGTTEVTGKLFGAATNSSSHALRIVTGEGVPTDWVAYNAYTVTMVVNFSFAGFTSAPTIFTSMGGATSHYHLVGFDDIYGRSATGFQVYVSDKGPTTALTPATMQTMGAYIMWTAIGK